MSSNKMDQSNGHSCCHGSHDQGHDHAHDSEQPASAKYFCPMCDGVVSDKPGACPMCGMALERNPAKRFPDVRSLAKALQPYADRD